MGQDRRERYGDDEEMLRMAMEGHQVNIWTALPGIIQSIDFTKQTCVVQPAIMGSFQDQNGVTIPVKMPLLVDCPLHFPSGGGCTLTFPVKKGDECLVVFASRCIDAWWQSGGIQEQAEFRMHDLSDGFAFVGFRSQPRVISGISATSTQLRSDDGATVIELDPAAHTLKLTAPDGTAINADTTINGALHVTGAITSDADVTASGISLKSHKHPGVQSGSSVTGSPQ